jgi:hypothetical protein
MSQTQSGKPDQVHGVLAPVYSRITVNEAGTTA